jgi:hypothetical protein
MEAWMKRNGTLQGTLTFLQEAEETLPSTAVLYCTLAADHPLCFLRDVGPGALLLHQSSDTVQLRLEPSEPSSQAMSLFALRRKLQRAGYLGTPCSEKNDDGLVWETRASAVGLLPLAGALVSASLAVRLSEDSCMVTMKVSDGSCE